MELSLYLGVEFDSVIGVEESKPRVVSSRLKRPDESSFPVILDWFSFSFSFDENPQNLIGALNSHLENSSLFISPQPKPGSGLDRYSFTHYIFITGTSLISGHLSIKYSNDSVVSYRLVFNGLGISYIRLKYCESDYFVNLIKKFNLLSPKILRVDLAIDDLLNQLNLFSIIPESYASGFFSVRRMPRYRTLVNNDNSGDTLYIGNRSSGKLLRCYHKGRQTHSQEYPHWVRLEIEMMSNHIRYIPLDVLLYPDEYFYGAYPKFFSNLFAFLDGFESKKCFAPIIDSQFSAEQALQRTMTIISRQYGAYLLAFRQFYDDEALLDILVRPHSNTLNGYPPSLQPLFI